MRSSRRRSRRGDGAAVRVVVVRSRSEKFFSAGADIKRFLANDVDANMDMIRLATRRWPDRPLAEAVRRLIAGHALGGGLEIALACDVRYAVAARSGSARRR